MKIDIEKLERKNPFPEPSEDFFSEMQTNVIAQTVEKNAPLVKKETKVFSLNLRWMAAAAVILIAGITVFLGFSNDSEISMAEQTATVDSFYEIQKPSQPTSMALSTNDTSATEGATEISRAMPVKTVQRSESSNSESQDSSVTNKVAGQDYAFENSKKPESEVEKVLAAFTPDQLRDLDKNSEQDLYLDLYN